MLKISHDLIKRLQFCVKDMPGCVYFKDQEGYYLACSDYLIKASGFTSEQALIGKTDYDIFSAEQAERLRENDLQVMNTGNVITAEEIITLPDGEHRYFEVVKVPFRNQNNEIVGVIGNSIDITERKQLEREKVAAEAKHQIVTDLANSIAHEIGNLLAGAMIYEQLLSQRLKPEITKHIKKHNDTTQETLELLNALEKCLGNAKFMFESIKMNIRQGGIDKSQFELANIAHDIGTVLNCCFPGEEIVETIKWNKDQDFEYIGIPSYTCNILINLIKNALYFIKEEKRGEITITLKKGKKFNQLIFEDTAKGIPTKSLPKLFTRFSTTRKGGTGMGLAFCKMVMQEYGGDITCESEFGKYTRFILTFHTVVIE